jgi:putative aldouronate transport system permease protein
MADADAAPLPPAKLSILKRLRRDYPVLLLAIPGMLVLCAFQYYPLWGNVIAFQDYQALEASR